MRKTVVIVVIALIVVCGGGGYAVKGWMAKAAESMKPKTETTKVTKGDVAVTVVDNGTIDAVKSVDVKGRVTGRLASLMVDEGDFVTQGQLIATIDPKETVLRVEQDQAQLSGALSAVQRQRLEIDQRRKSVLAAYNQAKVRVDQLALEAKAQPTLTTSLINQAEAGLMSAQQEKKRLTGSAQPTQRIAAQSAIDEAQANYDNAEREKDRQADLLQKGYVSGKVAQSAALAFDLAKVRLNTTKDNMSKIDSQFQAELAKADQSIREAQAALVSAKANSIQNELKRQEYLSAVAALESAKAAMQDPAIMEQQKNQSQSTVSQLQSVLSDSQRQLGETKIIAPISGVVTVKGLQVGELATGLSQFGSGTTIVKIEDRRSMRVKLNMNEIDVAKMAVGMRAKIDVDALPDETFEGVVMKIAPASTASATGTQSADAVVRYEVEIQISKASNHLRSGMSAKCTIDISRKKAVPTLPITFVQKEGDKYYVYRPAATPEAKPSKVEVKIGAMSGTEMEILSGVVVGDEVVKPPYTGPDRQGMMQGGGPG